MNKNELERFIDKGFSQRQLADHLDTSQTNIRYWLKKYELSTKRTTETGVRLKKKLCKRCDVVKDISEFSYNKKRMNGSCYCKKCHVIITTEKRRELKRKAVAYKGGACVNCGYSKCIDAMVFHHTNPEDKDYGFSDSGFVKRWDAVVSELDKCQLLCCRCHQEIHYTWNLEKENKNNM